MSAKQSERQDRLAKLEKIRQAGINPYPATAKRTMLTSDVLADFANLTKHESAVTVAGRLRAFRTHGNICFMELEDRSGRLQLVASKSELGSEYKALVKLIDMGDFIESTGKAFVTKAGEKSLRLTDWHLLTKSLRGLPDEHYGLKNEEERLRKRYLDILLNPEVKAMIIKKDRFWNAVRDFLKQKNFIEVETPALEAMPGGADARPFKTHHHALDMDVYLRISMGELWQKKLMVAGLERTFEIGRQFRNEGMDAEHLQDYTQMEFYWAYADYEQGMELVEEMYKYVAKATFNTLKFTIGEFEVDLSKPWQRYDYRETVLDKTGIDILEASLEDMVAKLKELGVQYDTKGFNITRAIDNLWKYCRKQIGGPGFLVGVPLIVSPLAKKLATNPQLTQRFQPIIAGSELGNGYSELNDPIDQATRFDEQQALRDAGDDEAQRKDDEFVEALEYGMPPTCGYGMSERVFSFLMNKTARECQIFPLMKPKNSTADEQNTADKKAQTKTTDRQTAPQATTAAPAQQTNELPTDKQDLGLDYEAARALFDRHISEDVHRLHMLESEYIMRALAKHLGEDEQKWGIIGLLHDIDWQETKDDPGQHGVKAIQILRDAGGSQFLVNTIISHCYGNSQCSAYTDKQRSTKLEHLLAAAETLTGLIVATALVRPDKKLASVELKSLKKKFKNKAFAANCDRSIILECEQAGLSLDDFLAIGLTALKERAEELNL